MATNHHKYNFDSGLEMKDAGLVASSAAAQVDSADKIINLGDSYVEGALVIDVTAIEVASGNEQYIIGWQLSDSSTFASGIYEGASLILGDSTVVGGDADSSTGRYVLRVSNEFNGTIYTYARVYTTVAGTVATGINFSAYLCPG